MTAIERQAQQLKLDLVGAQVCANDVIEMEEQLVAVQKQIEDKTERLKNSSDYVALKDLKSVARDLAEQINETQRKLVRGLVG